MAARAVDDSSEGTPGADSQGDGANRFSRVFDVLELLGGHPHGLTVTEISKRLELPTSSTHNLLQRMVGADVVVMTESLRYSIGSRAVRLSIRIVDGLEVRAVARRYLPALARQTGEDVYLAMRLGERVTYVDRVQGTRSVTVDIRLGQSLYLHATSVGKLFAAHNEQLRRRLFSEPRPALTDRTLVRPEQLEPELDTILRQGYSISREESILGVVGLAVPIRDAYATMTAALHISVLDTTLTRDEERDLIEAASATAAAIENELGRASPDHRRKGQWKRARRGPAG